MRNFFCETCWDTGVVYRWFGFKRQTCPACKGDWKAVRARIFANRPEPPPAPPPKKPERIELVHVTMCPCCKEQNRHE